MAVRLELPLSSGSGSFEQREDERVDVLRASGLRVRELGLADGESQGAAEHQSRDTGGSNRPSVAAYELPDDVKTGASAGLRTGSPLRYRSKSSPNAAAVAYRSLRVTPQRHRQNGIKIATQLLAQRATDETRSGRNAAIQRGADLVGTRARQLQRTPTGPPAHTTACRADIRRLPSTPARPATVASTVFRRQRRVLQAGGGCFALTRFRIEQQLPQSRNPAA